MTVLLILTASLLYIKIQNSKNKETEEQAAHQPHFGLGQINDRVENEQASLGTYQYVFVVEVFNQYAEG